MVAERAAGQARPRDRMAGEVLRRPSGVRPPDERNPPAGAARYTRAVTRTYIAVVVVEVLVLAALWFLSQHFAA